MTLRRFPRLLCLLASLLVVFCVLHWYFAATIGRVTIEGKFPPGAVLEVNVQNAFGGIRKEKVALGDQPLNIKKRVGTSRINAPAESLNLVFFLPNGSPVPTSQRVVNIYNVQIEQPFAGLTVISKRTLSSFFNSADFFGDNSAFVSLKGESRSAVLVNRVALPKASVIWAIWPAIFISLLVTLVVRNHRLRDLPALKDLSLGAKISSRAEFDAVNGIRGLAALLVLFSHAAPGFEAVNMGIALLFVISGFLLSKPFVLDSQRIYSWQNIERYLVKRIKRILPMYYTFIFITYGLAYEFDTVMRNMLFVEASGHLWPMTQIFTFYMCLPLVLLLTSWLWRQQRWLPVLALAVLAVVWHQYFSDWRPYYNGRFFKEFYLYAFVLGVAGAYLHFDIMNRPNKGILGVLGPWLLLVLTVVAIAWSAPVQPPGWAHLLIKPFFAKCVVSLIIIVLFLQFADSWAKHILANPVFKSVGVIGFSFYLLHGIGIDMAYAFQTQILGLVEASERSWLTVALAFAMTYIMAVLTYSYIERPFFGYRESQSDAGKS